jgi:phenylacetaldehyde dehydrogenase
LRKNVDRLATIEVEQIGRPIREMRFQLSRLPEWFEYFAAMIRVQEDSVRRNEEYFSAMIRVQEDSVRM